MCLPDSSVFIHGLAESAQGDIYILKVTAVSQIAEGTNAHTQRPQ
jgi:hypothetical protein